MFGFRKASMDRRACSRLKEAANDSVLTLAAPQFMILTKLDMSMSSMSSSFTLTVYLLLQGELGSVEDSF